MRTLRPEPLYTPSRSQFRTHWHLTDLHLGHAACDERQLRDDVARIAADPFATWGGGGDYIDGIIHKDPRYRASSAASWLGGRSDLVRLQVDRFLEIVAPIAGKCLYMTKGNHEDSVLAHQDRDAYREMVRGVADLKGCEMRDLALGWEGFVVLTFRRGDPRSYGGSRRLTLYIHHGAGGGRRKGAHGLRAEEVMWTYEADLYMLGHRHNRDIITKQIVKPSGRGVKFDERVCVWGGSYLAAYNPDDEDVPRDNYPQAKQLPPMTPGSVPVLIKPDVPRVVPIVTNGRAGELMDALRQQTEAALERAA